MFVLLTTSDNKIEALNNASLTMSLMQENRQFSL